MHPGGPPMGTFRRAGREDLDATKAVNRALVRRVVTFTSAYRRKLLLFLAVITGGALLGLLPPLLFKEILDHAIPDRDRGLVATLALITVAAAIGAAALDLAQRWYSSVIGEGVIFDLRTALYDHVHRMPIAFFTRTQTGALVSRMNNDVIGAQRALTGTLGNVVFNALTLVTTLGAMFLLHWQLTLLALVVLPVFIIPANRVGARLQDVTREGMEVNASMNATMTERFNVSGAMLVKLFGRHDDEVASFSRKAGRVRDIGVRSAMLGRIFFGALALVAAIGTAVIYGVGANEVISGSISPGTLVALAAYVTRIYQPLTQLTNARLDVLLALVSFERVFELLDTPRLIEDRPGAQTLTEPLGRVDFDEVWFRYPAAAEVSVASLEGDGMSSVPLDERAGVYVLEDITASIQPGQLVALVGPSGAGKTTLASLVPRLYDVTRGSIRVDGHDVRDLTQASLRDAIGVVSQDPHLFHDTVASNLRYARPDATDDELVEACRAAQIHHVVAALPDGYDTVVGERGHRLSGGEKQRLAIARMLLKDPAVVILDEATSHLDAENESLVQQALATGLAGRTSLVIAHRLSTIQSADQILVLDEGRIVERGTHATLLADGGLYAELYRTLVPRVGLTEVSGRGRHGPVTRALHWLTGVALGAQFTIGYVMDTGGHGRGRGRGRSGESGRGRGRGRGGDGLERFGDDALLTAHVVLGVSILVLAALRLWWRRRSTLPPWAPQLSPAGRFVEHKVELVLYALLFLIPLSGLWLVLVDDDALALHVAAHLAFFTGLVLHVALVIKHRLLPRML